MVRHDKSCQVKFSMPVRRSWKLKEEMEKWSTKIKKQKQEQKQKTLQRLRKLNTLILVRLFYDPDNSILEE